MIASLAYLFLYLSFGVITVRCLLPRHRPLNRLWLGLSLGLLEEMTLPAAGAFFLSFTPAAHVFAAGVLLILTVTAYLARDRRDAAPWDDQEKAFLRQLLIVALPLTLLGAWLQYTHTMRPDESGSWHVGQSTYGDLPMHLSFITNLPGKRFPADYPFFPGNRLSYPFLTDSLSATFYLFGASLQLSVILPGTLMMALCYTGVLILGRNLTAGKRTAVLAALLFFLNGGLGFLYDFDLAGGLNSAGEPTVFDRVRAILNGYYKTPTNQPDPNNLRWSNIICDMLVPQRTFLGGLCMFLPCLYLLDSVFRPRMRDPENGPRGLLLLSLWAGCLPLIHTHSFLALGLMTLGAMLYDLIHGDPNALMVRRSRWQILRPYLVFAGITVLLAAPQLFFFTFHQTFQPGSRIPFLTFQFNWVNNPRGRGMRDLYLWFYLKNIGLPFLALLLALFEKNPRHRRLFAMALPIILAAEFIRFQPNEYDNNKLFYLAWLLCCLIVADWSREVWQKLKGFRGRYALAVFTAITVFLSAGLTVWRECVSDYVAFSAPAVETGEYVRDHTEPDAVFITGTQHLNPVSSIAGRSVVCGPNLWLYYHGFDISEREMDLEDFYADPAGNQDIPEKYGADYIYVSSYERNSYEIDIKMLDTLYKRVFSNDEAIIWQI